MNILQSRESIENPLELLAESLLCVLDLPSIKTCMAEKRFFISDQFSTQDFIAPATVFNATNWVAKYLEYG